MIRIVSLFLVLVLLLGSFGTTHIEDPAQYGQIDESIPFPSFFPESVTPFQVNAYSYTLYSYMDVCYEIFLDLTVTRAQLEELLTKVRACAPEEKQAYYAEGYFELVFTDVYSLHPEEESANVWNARIEKVIYNPETCHIVFESFDAFDSGVYPLEEVAYFNRFGIDQVEYMRALEKKG